MKNKITAVLLGVLVMMILTLAFYLSSLYSPISEVLLSNSLDEWTRYGLLTVHEIIMVLVLYIPVIYIIKKYQLVTYEFSSIMLIQLPILLLSFKVNILTRHYTSALFFNPYILSSLLVTFLLMFGLVALYLVDKRWEKQS